MDYDEQQDERAAEERLAAQQRRNDLRTVLSTESGRRFIWGVIQRCGVFQGASSLEPMNISYSEGRRSVGLFLLGDVMAFHPDLFLTMQKENTNV